MEAHSFASLAQIRILLLPVGGIEQEKFKQYASEIRNITQLRLEDIPSDNKDQRARFMPNPTSLATGHLHISYPTHPPPHSHYPLSLLRPSHFPLAVIGIASSANAQSLNTTLAQFNSSLLDIFPAGAVYPLARTCFVFEESEDTDLNAGHDLGLVIIPSMMGNKGVYVNTKLCDLCAQVLGEFGVLVQHLESPQGNEYLNSSLLPVLPPFSELPTPLDADNANGSLPPLPSHNSQPEVSKSNFTLAAAPTMKRNSSSGPVRQSTLGPSLPAKKHLSAIGVASSPARLFKIYGDFYLLAGRLLDAEQWYSEALSMFKTTYDPIWQGAATESLSIIPVLNAWQAGQPQADEGPGLELSSDISNKLEQALALYQKAPSDGQQDYALLSLLYCQCVLRETSLLFSIWISKGWGPGALNSMLNSGPMTFGPSGLSETSNADMDRRSSISDISRSSISNILSQVHGPWLLHLGPRERISVLETTASIYSSIGYRRKEAYILREVLGCVLDLVVCGREEDGLQKNASQTGLGLQMPGPVGTKNHTGIRVSESIEGNASVLGVIKHICKVLGINLEAVTLEDPNSPMELEDRDLVTSRYEEETMEGHQDLHGWPELQVGVIREAVAVAEALPDFPSVAQFCLSALKALHMILSSGDQYHFYATAARALLTSQRRGITKLVSFWSGRPIVSISLFPAPPARLPVERPSSALHPRQDVAPVLIGRTDPFFYNPRRAAVQSASLVIQNEPLEFEVHLQNPYIFDLELQSLSLSTEGVPFETQPIRVVIPASSYHPVILTGSAAETGSLTVRGCIAQTPGGQAREFVLPLATDAEEEKLNRRRGAIASELGRYKYSGLHSFPWNKGTNRASGQAATNSKFQFLQFKVIPEQPLMRIRRSSITHGAIMLFDGEMSTLTLVLENISHLPVDFIRLAFDDSTIAPAQQALAEGDLSVFQTYETEYELLHRPLLSWDAGSSRDVSPGDTTALTVRCLGKVGCTHATIHISYGFVHRSTDEPETDKFHIRQLTYPVMVTVYQMLETQNMNLLPISDFVGAVLSSPQPSQMNEDDWCLFSIEVRNLYGQPFEVSFDRMAEGEVEFSSTVVLPPGTTSRIVLPVRRFRLAAEHTAQSIPTLSDRQFVVTKTKLSREEEYLQRELFWYREELFKHIRARWKEVGGIRHGDLTLRQQRLTLPMLEVLRSPVVQVHMQPEELSAESRQLCQTVGTGIYSVPIHRFLQLRTKISNVSRTELSLSMDMVITPSDHFIYQGVLQDQSLGKLKTGETREFTIPVCFLSRGHFKTEVRIRTVGGEKEDIVGHYFGTCMADMDQ